MPGRWRLSLPSWMTSPPDLDVRLLAKLPPRGQAKTTLTDCPWQKEPHRHPQQ